MAKWLGGVFSGRVVVRLAPLWLPFEPRAPRLVAAGSIRAHARRTVDVGNPTRERP